MSNDTEIALALGLGEQRSLFGPGGPVWAPSAQGKLELELHRLNMEGKRLAALLNGSEYEENVRIKILDGLNRNLRRRARTSRLKRAQEREG